MGNNSLNSTEKNLRSIAKKYKSVKYSIGLAILFLMMGLSAFSQDVMTTEEIASSKENLRVSVGTLQNKIDTARKENEKTLQGLKLELVQLMEQGDQVVKSPWMSWQFGANYMYDNWSGTYKGRGDKKEKYPYEGIYTRSTSAFGRSTSARTAGQKAILNSIIATNGGFDPSNTGLAYGLIGRSQIGEDPISIEVSAGIRPKNIQKGALTLSVAPVNITQPNPSAAPGVPNTPGAPNINIPSFSPVAPKVEAPALPVPPTFSIILGADCNVGCDSGKPRQNQRAGFTLNTGTQAAHNIQSILHYTWPTGTGQYNLPQQQAGLAFKMYADTGNNFTLGTTTPASQSTWGSNSAAGNVGNEYYFNSYNFGDNTEFGAVLNSDSGSTPDKNHQHFFVGGSRFIESDNAGTNTITIPSGYTVNLGGILTLALVSQGHDTTQLNQGKITDVKEKDDPWIANMTYNTDTDGDGVNDSLKILGPTTDYYVKRNEDGYVGYKVGIALVQEDAIAGGKILNDTTGVIDFKGERSIGLYTYIPNAGSVHRTSNRPMTNKGEISLSGNISAGFATSDFKSGVSVSTIAINNGNVNISGDNSHGMVVSKTTNALGPDSSFVNNGKINVTANDSGGMTVLGKIQGGATNNGTITITAKNSFGLYSQVDSSVKNTKDANIDIENGSQGSMGIRVGNASATNMKNEGTITIKSTDGKNIGVYSSSAKFVNEGKIKVNGANENIGMYFNGTTGTTGNQGTITVAGNKVYGVILNNATFENEKKIEVTSDGTDSIGLYLSNGSTATNKNGAIISNAAYHAVVQNTGTFTNAGVVSVEAGGKVGLYSENGTFTNASNGEIKSSNGGIAIFTSGSTGTVEGTVTVGDSGTSTGIGVYSDGSTTSTTFQGNAVLNLGERTVGLYSSKASNFGTAFTITNLSTSIGKKSVFAYFGNTGNTSDDTVDITNTTLQNLTVSSMGENSAVFYGAKNTTINIDGNITADSTKFSNINDSAQFLVSDAGKVNIKSSKILTSGFKTTISGLNGAVVTNDGKLILSGKDGAIGIYSNASKVTNNNIITTANNSSIAIYGKESSTLTNSGTGKITTSGTSSVGILANSSTVSNASGGEITTSGTGSAGIYGITNSTIENSGNITTEETGSAGIYADNSDVTNKTTGKITSKKGSSAGIYSTSASAKNVKNKGTIEVGVASSTETQNVGIYAEGNQNVENDGNINIHIGNSIGVYGKGANVVIENKKKITSDASASDAIGIMSEKAKVTNSAGSEKISWNLW